jgi:hypothetical protein
MAKARFLAALATAAAILVGVAAVASAAGPPSNSYLCYSKFQVDPGVWSDNPINIKGGLGGNLSSTQLLKLGYWSPWATKTSTTSTKLPNGYYLHCNPAGATTASTTTIGGAGEVVTEKTLTGLPGYYPAAP